MQLVPLQIAIDDAPMPPRVATYLDSARSSIDRWFARPEHQTGIGFVPSDYEQVWQALAAIKREHPETRRLLEWGSGFGVVAGLGTLLGLDAHGIEIEDDLITSSNKLLAENDLRATIVQGSFVPMDFVAEGLDDLETRTVLGQPDAYDKLGRDLDDFDLVFAYPWPTEEELYHEIFRHGADYGAILLTWSHQEGMQAHRKVAGTERPQ
ncbi:MAG: hypothetical protein ACI89X_001541 [Planctomycetota bacterium]